MQASTANGLGPQEQEEQQAQPQIHPVEQKVNALLNMLKEFDNAPDEADIYNWKEKFGKIFVTSVSGSDVYIFRTIKRNEYKGIAEGGGMDKAFSFQDSVVRKTLLWPKPDPLFISSSDAGVIETLFDNIMFTSGFIPKDQALSMIDRI